MRRAIAAVVSPIRTVQRATRRTYWTARVRWAAGSCAGCVRANHRTRVTRQTRLGKNVHFNGLEVVGGGPVSIGDNFHSGPGCLIVTSVHDYDTGDALPYGTGEIHKSVRIADNVWLGSRVTIIGDVEIGEGAIVQAGAVVVSDVVPCAIVGGNPARQFKMRDIDHYNRLKAEARFR